MLRIIETKNALPKFYPVDISSWFEPGAIAGLKWNEDKIVCGLSDSLNVVGILDDIRSNKILGELFPIICDSTLGSGKVTVWNTLGVIFETDQFENSIFEKINEIVLNSHLLLHCSKNGLFTLENYGDWHKPVANLLTYSKSKIRAEWL